MSWSPKKPKRHTEHSWGRPWRGKHRCEVCGKQQFSVNGVWRDSMTLQAFAEKWCPKIAGPTPETMLRVEAGEAFEWNSYESWDEVVRVRFDFESVVRRQQVGQGTRIDVMNGWRSGWHEDFCEIDAEAEAYYKQRTGRDYQIGDDCYGPMRAFIQETVAAVAPPNGPRLVRPGEPQP